MSIFDARKVDEFFDMGRYETYAFDRNISTSATIHSWRSMDGDIFTAFGTGFAARPDGQGATGAVTRLTVNLSSDRNVDVTVTGMSTRLELLTAPDTHWALTFWERMLSGDDLILAPRTVAATITGDFETVGFYAKTRMVTGGNDTIAGGTSVGQTLIGDALNVGNDDLRGDLTGGDDVIVARNVRGTSTIIGDAYEVKGNALINGRGHCDGGNDTLTGSDTRADEIIGDALHVSDAGCIGGADRIFGRGGNDTLVGDVRGVSGDIYSSGGSAAGGRDYISGGEGNDFIVGDVVSVDTDLADFGVNSGAGNNDVLLGDGGDDTIYGDTVRSTDSFNILFARFGNDRIYGGSGNDRLYGDALDAGKDPLYSSAFIDMNQGHDLIDGEDGDDRIYGGLGNDRMLGGTGNDIMNGQFGHDRVYGGAGDDVLYGDDLDSDPSKGLGHDYLDGGEGADRIFGGLGNDRIFGGTGNDIINGQTGDDQLHGGDGDDLLNGGAGIDRLWGDSGADTFIFGRGTGTATIIDFNLSEDILDLRNTATDFQSAADVQAAATTTANVTTINLGGGGTLILLNFDSIDLAMANFLF
jgi:hypothetical protein